ncbi:MAG TPA: alkaline phosphatase family protein [Actinopolymorphaceae bacterium]|jgi:predicted AlkP superfamily pyrophosphatase or phosphodiesterase
MPDAELSRKKQRVVVFGVDGVRYDTLRAARTPRIDAIAAAGFLAPVQVNQAGPTISGPTWATVASGVLATTHGIFNNELYGHRLDEHPDFLTRVRQAIPGAQTFAAGDWPPLMSKASGGPIFRDADLCLSATEHGPDSWQPGEDRIASEAAKALGTREITAAFIYFVGPDVVAHARGVCPEYVAAIEESDARIGRILDAIQARPTAADEEWTVIVVTDHGHVDTGGHGGDSAEERTAWIAAAGPTVPAQAPADLEQADVHAQVLHTLGIPIAPDWNLFGRPFSRAHEPRATG